MELVADQNRLRRSIKPHALFTWYGNSSDDDGLGGRPCDVREGVRAASADGRGPSHYPPFFSFCSCYDLRAPMMNPAVGKSRSGNALHQRAEGDVRVPLSASATPR